MQGGDHGQLPLTPEIVDEVQHLLLMTQVQRGGRLVQQQHGSLLRERPRHHGPLPLAPRE